MNKYLEKIADLDPAQTGGGAAAGGVLGGLAGYHLGKKKFSQSFKPPETSDEPEDIHSIHRDLESPPGGFASQEEAVLHRRRMNKKYHPDRGGSSNDMARINTAWTKFETHPQGLKSLPANKYLKRLGLASHV